MLQRRYAAAVGDAFFGPRFDERAYVVNVIRATVAEYYRLDQGCPSKVVDVVKRSTAENQTPDYLIMAEMRCGNERRAVVGTGNVPGACA